MERHGTSQEEVVIIKQQKRHRLIHHSYNKNRIYYSVFAIFIIEIYNIHVMSHQIISVDTHGTSIAKLVKSELPAPKKHPFLGQPSGPQQFLAI